MSCLLTLGPQVPSVEGAVEVAPSTNVVPTKKSKEVKEKGQGRRERRAKAAAEEAVKQSEQGNEGDDANRTGTVGAYVHISRISDERVDHVEKLFKPGQQVILPYS